MKRVISFIVLCMICTTTTYAHKNIKNDQGKWGSVGVSAKQIFMLNDWFDDASINQYMKKYPYPYVEVNVTIRLFKEFGLYHSLGFGNSKQRRVPDTYNSHATIDLNNFYMDEVRNYSSNSNEFITHGDFGFYYKLYHQKWVFYPCVSLKVMEYDPGSLTYALKEKGTNHKLLMDYVWGRNNITRSTANTLLFLSLKFKGERKLSKRFNLDFGCEINLFGKQRYYYESIKNYYTEEELYSQRVKGNKISSVGLSVGVSFR